MNLLYVIHGWFSALDWYLWDGLKPQSTRLSTKQQCSRGQWLMDWINPGWILQVVGILFQTLYPSEFQRWSGVVELSCIILIYIFLIISNCNCIFFYVCVCACFLCALDVLFSFNPQWRAQGIFKTRSCRIDVPSVPLGKGFHRGAKPCFICPSIGHVIIPTVTHSIIFQRGGEIPPTSMRLALTWSNQILIELVWAVTLRGFM